MDLIGQVLGNRYRIVERLGSGGMGTVYLAEHTHLGRPTALKILRRELLDDPLSEERFRREAMLAARIDHEAVAQIYDFDIMPSGEFMLAMEYVEGETVAARLRREGKLALPLAVAVLRVVASGLDRAHSLKILHRDLKPENVMLAAGGTFKLLDFGVARTLDSSSDITSSGFAVGTPVYMSPEQLTADALTAATDIYSLGVLFYEMLSGKVPHDAPTVEELRVQRFTHPPVALNKVRDECSPALASVVSRALAVDPAGRWPSAGAFAAAVVECTDTGAVAAAPVRAAASTTVDRLDRWDTHFEALRFAGRDRVVRQARDAWSTARMGRSVVLWLEGGEGDGKSALLDLALRIGKTDGAFVLSGRGYHVDVARPYGAWHPILRAALELRGAATRAWPSISALTDASTETEVLERGALFDEVSAILRAVASKGPLIVAIDDLDACDPASVALFEFVARDVVDVPLLLAVTAHVGPHNLSMPARERLRRLPNVTWVTLRPLGYDALHTWLSGALGQEAREGLVRYVYGHSEGNAFFVEQIVRSLLDRGNLEQASDEQLHVFLATEPAPEAVAEVVKRRLAGLSAAAREIVQIAAVIGREFDVDLVLALSRHSEDEVMSALDEAELAGILEPVVRSGGDWYRFTHGKFGEVHAQAMNQRRRRLLHARIAEALEQRSETSSSSLARHWYHADEPGRAAPHALEATEHALRVNDYDDAVAHAMLAAEVAQRDSDRVVAHELRGDALRRLDRHIEAAAAYAKALLATADPPTRLGLRCKELRSALLAGSVSGENAAAELHEHVGSAVHPNHRVLAEVALAEAHIAAEQLDQAVEVARHAAVTAVEAESRYNEADATLLLGTAFTRLGQLDEAAKAVQLAAMTFKAIPDEYGLARAAMARAEIAGCRGDATSANSALDDAVHHAERAGVTRIVRVVAERRQALEADAAG